MIMYLKVTDDFALIPVADNAIKYVMNRKVGDMLKCEIKRERNYVFLQKAFCLVRVVHEALPEPEPVIYQGRLVQPIMTLDDTRKYLTVLAGEYDVIGLPDGSIKVEARSWSFEKMTEEHFEIFYSNLIDACLKALPDTWTDDELERVALEVIGYV